MPVDWKNYKFRASSLPCLMTKARAKSEVLSETAKACLREIWIKEMFGRERFDTQSKFTDKGVECESDSLDLVKTVLGKTYFKNKRELSNDWIKGTPDIIVNGHKPNQQNAPISAEKIIDIKTSWDIWTFSSVDGEKASKDYFYQILGYMWLTGSSAGNLVYCLVNTPEHIISNELYKLSFRYPDIGTSDEADAKYRKNYLFDDIDPVLRLKDYSFVFSSSEVENVKVVLSAAREYLEGLSL